MRPSIRYCCMTSRLMSVEGHKDAYAVEVEMIEERDNGYRSIALSLTPDEADKQGDRLKTVAAHARYENERIAGYQTHEKQSAIRFLGDRRSEEYKMHEADLKKALAIKRCPSGLDTEECWACANLPGYKHINDARAARIAGREDANNSGIGFAIALHNRN